MPEENPEESEIEPLIPLSNQNYVEMRDKSRESTRRVADRMVARGFGETIM